MPEGQVLEFSGLTKRFGAVTAVSDFSARVEPGRVTAFLGPNGAGKTTTLRILLGLVRATDGTATIGGKTYAKLANPLQTVGAVLEASSFHPGRTAANHLKVYARAARIPNTRVDEVLGLVGLADAAGRKVGGFSLGMRQRLGLAYALLGDPGVLVLDEPANGLDPEGIKWMRGFLRQLAREGRTLLVSSHLLTEVQQTVDALVVISQGRLVFQGGLDELADPSEYATVVDAPDRAELVSALNAADVPFEVLRSGVTVRGLSPVEVGAIAAGAGVGLAVLQRRGPALEEVFLELVNGTRVHASAAGIVASPLPVDDTQPESEPVVAQADEPATDDPATAAGHDGAERAEPVHDDEAAHDVEVLPAADDETSDDASAAEGTSDDEPGIALAAGVAGFAVASTGVIDIIASSDGTEPGDDGASDAETDADAGPAGGPLPDAATGAATVWVSDSTGAIQRVDDAAAEQSDVADDEPDDDIDVESPPEGDVDDAPEDADPDVEAIAAVDEGLGDGDPRPFDDYEKTDADREADAFFSAFSEPDEDEPDEETSDDTPVDDVEPATAHEGGEQR